MARWFEGDITFRPGYDGPASDDETAERMRLDLTRTVSPAMAKTFPWSGWKR